MKNNSVNALRERVHGPIEELLEDVAQVVDEMDLDDLWDAKRSDPYMDEAVQKKLDDLRKRVIANPVVASVVRPGDFDFSLHPRGRDGRFIHKFGFVKWIDKGKVRSGRVVGYKKSDSMWDKIDVTIFDPETSQVVVKPARELEKTFRPKGYLTEPSLGKIRVVTPEEGRASRRQANRINVVRPEDRQQLIEQMIRSAEPLTRVIAPPVQSARLPLIDQMRQERQARDLVSQ